MLWYDLIYFNSLNIFLIIKICLKSTGMIKGRKIRIPCIVYSSDIFIRCKKCNL